MLPRTGRPPLFHWALVVVTGALGPVNQAGKPLRRSTFQGQTRVIAPKFFMQASFTAVNPPTFPAARGRAVGQCPIIYWVPSRVWSGAGLWGVCQGPALDCGMKRPPSRATSVFLPAPRAPVHRAHCGGKGGGSRPAGKPPPSPPGRHISPRASRGAGCGSPRRGPRAGGSLVRQRLAPAPLAR